MFKKRVIKNNDESSKKRKLQEEHIEDDSITAPIRQKTFKKSESTPSKHKPVSTTAEVLASNLQSKNEPATEPVSRPQGILKNPPKNINITTITDFQPDVCKDFFQTGYCGYGDTCKFLHIRDESRQKKPIEKEWENITKKKEKQSEDIPFKCVLCKNDYKSPIKTQCGHLYCKACFLKDYKSKKTKCFICRKETNGVMVPISKSELESLIGTPVVNI
ncbi:Pre-mRNA-splicing factor CWC24 [Spathaspora sp. JA1]|nr:Pre-mRNA-splicing factor CWC24 [Spathaspora sp. JA1]